MQCNLMDNNSNSSSSILVIRVKKVIVGILNKLDPLPSIQIYVKIIT